MAFEWRDGSQMTSVVVMIGGVIIIALPITVIGSNFAKMVEIYQEVSLLQPRTQDPAPASPSPHTHTHPLS